MLESTWITEWEKKADRFKSFAEEARQKENVISVSEYYALAARCYYACYLLNSDLIENKKKVYENFEHCYEEAVMNSERNVQKLEIPFNDNAYLPGYLHLPKDNSVNQCYGCVVIFTGMGSSKEEVEVEVSSLVSRGVAVLAVDMPGTGSALFKYGLTINGQDIERSIDSIMDFIVKHPLLDEKRIATYGLCMGGGYAYRAAAKYPEIKCSVNLFPLFITMLEDNAIPRWMKAGKWAEFQLGTKVEETMENMKVLTEGNVKSSYLIVRSEYDNWMDLEKTQEIFDKTTGHKEEIIIKDFPVYASKESVMHAMPVGEQLHWVKIKAADFIKEILK